MSDEQSRDDFQQDLSDQLINTRLNDEKFDLIPREIYNGSTTEETLVEGNDSGKKINCSLLPCGCSQYDSNRWSQHLRSEQHTVTVQRVIQASNLDCQITADEVAVCAFDDDNSDSNVDFQSKKERLDHHRQFSESITSICASMIEKLNLESRAASDPIDFINQNVLQKYDRHDQRSDDSQLTNLMKSNCANMCFIGERFQTASGEEENEEGPQNFMQNFDFGPHMDHIFKDRDKADSTLIYPNFMQWKISQIDAKINKSVHHQRGHFNSPCFQTSIEGQNVFVRLFLNGNGNQKYIGIQLRMNFPGNASFTGEVKFILVHQYDNGSYKHIVKICKGSLKQIGDFIGCDEFTDKQNLHQFGNEYIKDDQIYIIVQLRAEGETKFGNIPNCIRDAIN